MSYAANILADSLSPDGVRLTTLQATHPRFILAEVNTHRILSRNSASSRAIPPEKQIERVLRDAFVPETFNKRVKGMGVGDAVDEQAQEMARSIWLEGRDAAVDVARRLCDLGLDKSRVNRVLEPYMWHSAIISATEWSNFFALRDHPAAQPEFQILAQMMREAMWDHEPREMSHGGWHLPGVDDDQFMSAEIEDAKRVSGRRMAGISFGQIPDEPWHTSIEKCGVLMTNGHVSPLEHQARPIHHQDFFDDILMDKIMISARSHHELLHGGTIPMSAVWCGNFRGWIQFRKEQPHEDNFARQIMANAGEVAGQIDAISKGTTT